MEDFFCYVIDALLDRQLDDPATLEYFEAMLDHDGGQGDDDGDSSKKAA